MALFKTIEKLAETMPVLESSAFATVLPALNSAEDKYLRRAAMGAPLYDALHAAYQTQEESISDPALAALLPLARQVSAHLAMEDLVPKINAQLTSGGVMVGQTPNLAPASRWRVEDLIRSHRRTGFDALDRLISKLNEEYNSYPSYNAHARVLSEGWLRNVEQFERVVPINRSGWLFQQLRPTILEVETTLVRALYVDPALFTLQRQMATDGTPPSPTDEPVREWTVRLLVHETLARAALNLSLAKDDLGVTTFASTMNGDGRGGPMPAGDSRVQALAEQARARSLEARDELVKALRAAADSGDPNYTVYRNSAAYAAGLTSGYRPDTDLSTFFTGM